jgi:pyruvate/2-oxoglutarate dehydrogenase complex dihydrolipoamide acyltransferase (E2) component
MNFELKMPDLSKTGPPIKVVRWLIAVGEFVKRDQSGDVLALLGT